MTLYVLKREYEERRQALIDKLKNQSNMDPAVQHQLYGAIKEIENFLQAIEFQIHNEQERSLNIELQRDRPKPFVERTKRFAGKVKSGTGRVFKEKIPEVTAKVTKGPRRFFKKRKEKKLLKKQIREEIRARLKQIGAGNHLHEEIPPELPTGDDNPSLGLSGTVTDVIVGDSEGIEVKVEQQKLDRPEDEPRSVPPVARKKSFAKKKVVGKKSSRKKASKKSAKKKSVKTSRKTVKKKAKKRPTRKR